MKRLRKPKLKDGELMVHWGRLPFGNPEILIAGSGVGRDDVDFLHDVMCERYSSISLSLIEELELRGYDITTIKFSIMKMVNDANTTRD